MKHAPSMFQDGPGDGPTCHSFERAIEGVEHHVYDEHGQIIRTKRVVSDRLIMFLLRYLKPERYAKEALAVPAPAPEPVEASLRALEPPLPAPPAELLAPDELGDALMLADIADGRLPQFLAEQPAGSPDPVARPVPPGRRSR